MYIVQFQFESFKLKPKNFGPKFGIPDYCGDLFDQWMDTVVSGDNGRMNLYLNQLLYFAFKQVNFWSPKFGPTLPQPITGQQAQQMLFLVLN